MTATMTCTATVETVKLTGLAKTAQTVEKRTARLNATKDRMEHRKAKSQQSLESAKTAEKKAEETVAKIQARLLKAQERLEKAKARIEDRKSKVVSVGEYADALIEKQTTELNAAQKWHGVTLKREEERVVKVTKVKTTVPAGTVITEAGKEIPLSKSVIETIKAVIGRKRSGILTTLSGDEGKVIDAIAKDIEPELLGEMFRVNVKGWSSTIWFDMVMGQLEFEVIVG